MQGVRVVVSSPTQIGGPKTAYSSAEGTFRFIGLFPGEFEVRASAPRLKTVIQQGVKVDQAVAEVNLVMEVETATETVAVVQKAPVVNTTTATVKQTFDGEFLSTLPGGNRNWTDVMSLAAGVREGGNPQVRGASGNRNSATLDGFNTVNPNNGEFGQLVSAYSMASTEIATAGLGAANGSTPGGAASMVTKSGSNAFELDAEIRYREPRTVELFQEAGEDDRDEYWLYGVVNLGGPIVKDRLWYYLSFEGLFITRYPMNQSGAGARKPDFSPPNQYVRPNFLQKLTWQMAPRHKLSVLGLTTPERSKYFGGWQNYSLDPEADNFLYRWRILSGATWEALLSDRLLNRMQVGYQFVHNENGPMKCDKDPKGCDLEPRRTNSAAGNYVFGNAPSHWWEMSGGLQVKNTTEYFVDGTPVGDHAATLGFDLQLQQYDRTERRTGDREYRVNGTYDDRETLFCINAVTSITDPCVPGKLRRTSTGRRFDGFLQDAWKPTRHLTLTPGIGYHQARYENGAGDVPFDKGAFTLHATVAWDATHDGKTVLRSGYNQYADLGGMALATYVAPGFSQRTCDVDLETGRFDRNCTFVDGSPSGRRVAKDLTVPKTHEITLGGEREVVTGVALGVDLIYRVFDRQFEDFEVNRVWNGGGTDLVSNGGFRNGTAQTIMELRTPDDAQRRYRGVTMNLSKREGALRALASYTWAQIQGRQPSSSGIDYFTSWGDNPAQDIYYDSRGYLPTDRRHEIRILATYAFTRWLSAGGIYRFYTGEPYNRRFFNTRTGFSDLHARQGYDPGVDINDPGDDRPLRLPDITVFNLQARADLKQFLRADLSVFVDYTNILALRGTTSVQQNDGPTFRVPSGRQSAPQLQLGLRYKY